jgi:hypothetical protein
MNQTTAQMLDARKAERQNLIARAWEMRLAGASGYAIAIELKVTKEWLRTYAGMSI